MKLRQCGVWVLAAWLMAGFAVAAPSTRAVALAALTRPDADARLAGVVRLAEIGSMADADRVLDRLADTDTRVRVAAGVSIWRIWGRSGDPKIDRLYARGLAQMQASTLEEALATFTEIVRLKPAFAEGWNKRATVLFLMGEPRKSLADCEEVFKRNPRHFGALAGAGQIHLQLGDPRRALDHLQRALAINPNLEGIAQVLPMLEQQLQIDDRNRI